MFEYKLLINITNNKMYDDNFIRIIINSRNINVLFDYLNNIADKYIQNKYFTWFAQLFFMNDSRYSTYIEHCWLLSEVPDNIINNMQITNKDNIDIVIKTYSNKFYSVIS
jgi:hypothetical protein